MKIYTKILIGMAIGAALGLLLGPQSRLLAKDTYRVDRASQASLRLDPGNEGTSLRMDPNVKDIALEILTTPEPVVQESGTSGQTALWVPVRLAADEAMKLVDDAKAQEKPLGSHATNDEGVDAWLEIKQATLPSGKVLSFPQAVSGLGTTLMRWIAPVGAVFMALIRMVVVPLVFASLVLGVASLGDLGKLGRLGAKTLGLFLVSTAVAVSIGIFAAHGINPGGFLDDEASALLAEQFQESAALKSQAIADTPPIEDNVIGIIPQNPIAALAKEGSELNLLQVIFFGVVFALALTIMGRDRAKPALDLLDSVHEAMVVIVRLVMALAPYGVAALIAHAVGTSGWGLLKALLTYAATVFAGFAIHVALFYGSLVSIFTKLRFFKFLAACRPAQLIAFSTSSSSATLPVSMECAENNMNISRSTTSFVIPLGATINMDGTAIYQGVSAIFLAQVYGVDLSFAAQLGIILTATAASIGTAGVPGAGIVTLAMVLSQAAIPVEGIALILGMERILDMFRTAINVTGDLAVAAAVATSEGETLAVSPTRLT